MGGHNPSMSPGQGSTRDLYGDRLKSSLDSIVPSEEEDIDRRGSLPATPRGQRMTDLVAFQERKKKKGKKDKHGFTWTLFVTKSFLFHEHPNLKCSQLSHTYGQTVI